MSWNTSTRKARLPRDWHKRVAATKARAGGWCEATEHHPQCDGIGRECDHHVRGDDHSLSNLRWLSVPCHKAKTAAESAQARADARASHKRPVEPHPGLLSRISPDA